MIIERYGIKLIKITEDHIEEVRKWRNAPSISDFMEYQEYITSDMQKRWYHSLNDTLDFYFVIEYKGRLIGLIHTSAIDWNKREGHAGLFIWDKKYQSTHIPVLASLSMVDFFFRFCTLEKIFAKVKQSNRIAINYNANLGFRLAKPLDNKEFQEYILEKGNYLTATENLHLLAEEVEEKTYKIKIESSLYQMLKSAGAINQQSEIEETSLVVTN